MEAIDRLKYEITQKARHLIIESSSSEYGIQLLIEKLLLENYELKQRLLK